MFTYIIIYIIIGHIFINKHIHITVYKIVNNPAEIKSGNIDDPAGGINTTQSQCPSGIPNQMSDSIQQMVHERSRQHEFPRQNEWQRHQLYGLTNLRSHIDATCSCHAERVNRSG